MAIIDKPGSAHVGMYAPLHTPERTPLEMTTRQTDALHSQKQQPDVSLTGSMTREHNAPIRIIRK